MGCEQFSKRRKQRTVRIALVFSTLGPARMSTQLESANFFAQESLTVMLKLLKKFVGRNGHPFTMNNFLSIVLLLLEGPFYLRADS